MFSDRSSGARFDLEARCVAIPARTPSSLRPLATALLLSCSTLAVALAAPRPAEAASAVRIVNQGGNGSNAQHTFGAFYTYATAGSAAAGITQNNATALTGMAGTAIELGSVGGKGGTGLYGVLSDAPGAAGGNAGAVSLVETGDISGGSNVTSPTALLMLYARGGNGGFGYSGMGAGGSGGAVTLDLRADVFANTSFTAGAVLQSQGGDAGVGAQGGTTSGRMALDGGGAGGTVKLTIAEAGSVITSGAYAPAVVASSLGGAGGTADTGLSSRYPSNGGAGGAVTVINNGVVATYGVQASAITLQSVGGAGGSAGTATFSTAVPGGRGGDGGRVTGANTGIITTDGAYSFGILAQSVSGAGGKGAASTFTSGGTGGAAGAGGSVTITQAGAIETLGTGAAAVFAQSVGGGYALDAFQASAASTSHSGGGAGGSSGILFWSSGGTGGAGGNGGAVSVTNSNWISTFGDAAYGVLAQSIGGGGGTGGVSATSGAFLAVALGGAGGGGGDGGLVTFTGNMGYVLTSGDAATAVLALSVGGGGGTGGYAAAKSVGYGLSASSSVGGTGGAGGKGGQVVVNNTSFIATEGKAALGIQALSIGGGGGVGGGANAFAVALPAVTPSGEPLPSVAISKAVGGSGGTGGAGGGVSVTNGAEVTTFGDEATAIQAMSIGGGGGTAGDGSAYGLAIAAPGAAALTATTAVGGSGGGGGAGGAVSVTNSGDVVTYGDRAMGIQAISIGGGGGNSGAASVTADGMSLYRTVVLGESIGGSGTSGGGSGGAVTVTHTGTVETWGERAVGLFAQSIGGGGGNGGGIDVSATSGLSFDKTLNGLAQKLPLADSLTLVHGLGGSGGTGGNGGAVTVTVGADGSIVTHGAQADGIFAQSVGGGGGTGGGGSAATEGTLAIRYTVGGTGGTGGKGGAVTVENKGAVVTYGDGAHAIFAQSVGGGGGAGGSLSADTSKTPDRVGEIWTTLKDAVGVTAYNTWAADKGNAQTKEQLDAFIKDLQDSDSYKYLSDSFKGSDFYKQMQSFGASISDYLDKQKKGATKLPDLSLTLAMGGSGGSGNIGGDIKVTNSGLLATYGDVAYAVFGQSVGGGGGQGGVAYASGTNKTNLSGTLGGSGGSGNVGGLVSVTNDGEIFTAGEASYGVFAQSVGGGGGVGVGALSGDNKNLTLNVTLGAKGGTGANGGKVFVTNTGTIDTYGDEAHGIVAQSVGGGGGAFLMNPANTAKTEESTAEGDGEEASAETLLALLKAVGIEQVPAAATTTDAPKKSGSFTLGGAGGASGAGGDVLVTHTGTIVTSGEAAFGILAQSVGGGGGISNAAGSPGGVKYAASYGGAGGAGGNGGSVSVQFQNDARIATSGDNAMGVFAQSVGGGGGYGGASVLQGWTLPIIGGAGGASGTGGAINITTEGLGSTLTLFTSGTAAHGVFAQSLGGGGGTVSNLLKTDTTVRATLLQVSSVLNGLITAGGGSGTVVDNIDRVPESLQGIVRLLGNDTDTVNTVLTRLTSLLDLRSASTGTGGAITINLKGLIETSGKDAYGIFAQSGFQALDGSLDSSRMGGNIDITYAGTLIGGSGEGAAIGVDGGKTNTITIGAGSLVGADSGMAIRASFGSETVRNSGTIFGDINLSTSTVAGELNRFENLSGGTYISNAAGTVELGTAGVFQNAGIFNVGGTDVIGTATVKAARFQQMAAGILAVDVTSTPAAGQAKSDLLKVTGQTQLAGGILVNVVNGLTPDTFRVITSDGALSGSIATASPTGAPFVWQTSINGRSVDISPEARFGPVNGVGATNSERSVMTYLQTIWASGSIDTDMALLFGAFANVTSAQDYMAGIDALVPEESSSTLTAQTLNVRASLNAALSCPIFEGSGTLMQESNCHWARVIGNWTHQTSAADLSGYDQNAITYRIGSQREVVDNWFVGATAGLTQSWLNGTDGGSRTEGTSGDLALSLKHQAGPWLLSLSGHMGYGRYTTDRTMTIGEDSYTSSGSSSVYTAGGRFRASYELAFPDWYVRPYADFDVMYTYMPAYRESGQVLALDFSAADQFNFAFSPNVEVGGRVNLQPGLWLRPYASAGMTFLAKDNMPVGVSFADDGGLTQEFTTHVLLPATQVNLAAGLQLFDTKGYELRAEYKADIADNYLSQELSARFAVQF